MANLFESDIKDITRLILLRHGRTPANKEARIGSLRDIPLAEDGREQVRKLAKRLESLQIDVLYSSPLLRTQQTAGIIAEHLSLDIILDPDLIEFDFGVISDKTLDEVEEELPEIYQELHAWMDCGFGKAPQRPIVPEAEKLEDFEERIERFCNKVLRDHPSQVVAVTTHMATIKGFMSHLFGPPMERHMNFNALNTSVTIVDFFKGSPVLTAFNDIRHLEEEYPFGRVNLI